MWLGIVLALILAMQVLFAFLLWLRLEQILEWQNDLAIALTQFDREYVSTKSNGSPNLTTIPSWMSRGVSTPANQATDHTPTPTN